MKPIPPELLRGPFTRARALELGVTSRMLEGSRFVRVFPRVHRYVAHVMTRDDWVTAAGSSLPDDAHLTGLSRLQRLGLDLGPRWPIRFVVGSDLHLVLPGIFLHRTKQLAPVDATGVVPAGAFIAYCARARVIDAIKVGDWLLQGGHLTVGAVEALALSATWRDGAHEALWVLDHLDPRSRSLKESETRAILSFAGLPRPEVNVAVDVEENVEVIGDLVYRAHGGLVVEYEGAQHQEERTVYVADLDRYGLMRAAGVPYVQVTKEKLHRPKTLVGEVYRALLAQGYRGPVPHFGEHWRTLFLPISTAVGPRRSRLSGRAVG
ncbi:hypothetical protein [Nocardioides pyridinolyticus]